MRYGCKAPKCAEFGHKPEMHEYMNIHSLVKVIALVNALQYNYNIDRGENAEGFCEVGVPNKD